MNRRDRGLESVGSEPAGREGPLDQGRTLGRERLMPPGPILIIEQDDVARGRRAGLPPRFVEQHQPEEPESFGLGQQVDEKPAEADGFTREIGPGHERPSRGRVALVEDEVEDAEDAVQSSGEFGQRRQLVGNVRVTNFGLGPDDSLRHRRRRGQERGGDLFGRQAADLPERQGHLGVGWERRMAAGKDQPELIIPDIVVVGHWFRSGVQLGGQLGLRPIEASPAAEAVDGLEPAGRHQPRARVRG